MSNSGLNPAFEEKLQEFNYYNYRYMCSLSHVFPSKRVDKNLYRTQRFFKRRVALVSPASALRVLCIIPSCDRLRNQNFRTNKIEIY